MEDYSGKLRRRRKDWKRGSLLDWLGRLCHTRRRTLHPARSDLLGPVYPAARGGPSHGHRQLPVLLRTARHRPHRLPALECIHEVQGRLDGIEILFYLFSVVGRVHRESIAKLPKLILKTSSLARWKAEVLTRQCCRQEAKLVELSLDLEQQMKEDDDADTRGNGKS